MMNEAERMMLKELHDFWMKPSRKGRKSRAEQIDDVLTTVQTGRLTFRAVLYLAGALVGLSVSWEHIKELIVK